MVDLETVKTQALLLGPDARASLVDALLESLDVSASDAASRAWFSEVLRRRREVDDGTVALLPGDDLFVGIDQAD